MSTDDLSVCDVLPACFPSALYLSPISYCYPNKNKRPMSTLETFVLCRRQVADENDDENGEKQADPPIAEAEATDAGRFAKPVGNRGTERACDDVGEPEGKDFVQAEQEVAYRR